MIFPRYFSYSQIYRNENGDGGAGGSTGASDGNGDSGGGNNGTNSDSDTGPGTTGTGSFGGLGDTDLGGFAGNPGTSSPADGDLGGYHDADASAAANPAVSPTSAFSFSNMLAGVKSTTGVIGSVLGIASGNPMGVIGGIGNLSGLAANAIGSGGFSGLSSGNFGASTAGDFGGGGGNDGFAGGNGNTSPALSQSLTRQNPVTVIAPSEILPAGTPNITAPVSASPQVAAGGQSTPLIQQTSGGILSSPVDWIAIGTLAVTIYAAWRESK